MIKPAKEMMELTSITAFRLRKEDEERISRYCHDYLAERIQNCVNKGETELNVKYCILPSHNILSLIEVEQLIGKIFTEYGYTVSFDFKYLTISWKGVEK